jgi:hypothetical protein
LHGLAIATLDRSGFAGPNIFATQGSLGLLSGATTIDFREPPQGEVRRTPLPPGNSVNRAADLDLIQ